MSNTQVFGGDEFGLLLQTIYESNRGRFRFLEFNPEDVCQRPKRNSTGVEAERICKLKNPQNSFLGKSSLVFNGAYILEYPWVQVLEQTSQIVLCKASYI
jgi:hypothetical protein